MGKWGSVCFGCQQLLAVSHVQITKLNVLSASPRLEIDVLRLA